MTEFRSRLRRAAGFVALAVVCAGVSSCSTTTTEGKKKPRSKEYFAESEYGVKASPRVVAGGKVPKGGGRYLVGKPYQVKGKTYVPRENPDYDKTGKASWYGSAFHGRLTANGEVYDQYHLSAAHPTMPLPSYARVTNLDNGTSVVVRVNDRGPFHSERIIDVSDKTAELLDLKHHGTAKVRVQYVGPARMDGHDMPFLMASLNEKGNRGPRIAPEGLGSSNIMVASNERSIGVPVPAPSPVAVAAPQLQPPVTATAFGEVDNAAAQPFEQFVMLPEFGPVLIPRPPTPSSFASAYVADEAAERPEAFEAFDAIIVRDDRLTQATIKAFAERRTTPFGN